jgi:hypothetical protein
LTISKLLYHNFAVKANAFCEYFMENDGKAAAADERKLSSAYP